MLWMFRSFSRVPEAAPYVAAILERRLAQATTRVPSADRETRQRLERLAAAAEGRQQLVADLARDVLFHWFDEPVLDAVTAEVARRDGRAPGRTAGRPVPHRPCRPAGPAGVVSAATARHAARRVVVRGRGHQSRGRGVPDRPDGGLCPALLPDPGAARAGPQQVRSRGPAGRSPTTSCRAFRCIWSSATHPWPTCRHWPPPSPSTSPTWTPIAQPVVDLVLWREDSMPPVDEMSQHVQALLEGCDFGRSLHRLDLTITSLAGRRPQRDRTQHITFRHDADGALQEELLYRNLHPMLGKRLDLWRLSNFTLERLTSPEDVYLFHGVARDNPRDHRLFALAEVRDLVRVRNEESGEISYPRLGRIGLEALAAMRAALVRYPPRQRPTANRLVLSVRPTWDVPPEDWNELASSYEILARGAGLEKLVLHVKIAGTDDQGGMELQDKVLYLEGIGKGLLSIRLGEPGPDPVRPLTAYAQKVLTSERFGVPYPYEIVRMLTPVSREASGFPPGSFTELDLDADGETLVEVRRRARSELRAPGGRADHQPHRGGAGGDDPGGAPVRPDPGSGEPRRAGVPADQRRPRLRVEAPASGRVVRRLLRRTDRDGLRHREHGLDRADPAPADRVHPGRRRGQHHRHRHQRRRPALLERRGHDADAHQGDPGDDAGQHDGAHRQAGAGLLRCRVRRRQLRHRRLRPGHGSQRAGTVLGSQLRRRMFAAAAALRLHLRRSRRAVPPSPADERRRRARRLRLPAPPGARLVVHHRGRGVRGGDQPGPEAALRHALGDAGGERPGLRAPRALAALGRQRHLDRLGRHRRRHPGVPARAGVAHCPAQRLRPFRRTAGLDLGDAVPAVLPQDRPGGQRLQRQPAAAWCWPTSRGSTAPRSRCATGSWSTAPRSAGR